MSSPELDDDDLDDDDELSLGVESGWDRGERLFGRIMLGVVILIVLAITLLILFVAFHLPIIKM